MSNGIDGARPVVWCRKIHKTGEYEKSSSGHIAVWTSDSAKAFLINSSIPTWYIELGKFEKYTGGAEMSDIKDIDEMHLTFGKYRGFTPVEVSLIDRQYIVWMYNNVKPTPCSLELMLECEEEIEHAELKAYFDAENYGDRD